MIKILLIIFGTLILLMIIGGFIIYNFMPIKVATFCVSNEVQQTALQCNSNQQCIGSLEEEKKQYLNIPEFLSPVADDLIKKSIYCNNVCSIKKVKISHILFNINIDPLVFEKTNYCDGEEVSVKLKIKEIVHLLKEIKKFKQ